MGDARDREAGGDRALQRDAAASAEARYRELTAHLPDYVASIDRTRRYRWVNRVAPGVTFDEVLGGSRVDDYVPADELPRLAAIIERVFETGQPDEFEVEAYRDGRDSTHYRTRVVPGPPEEGEPRVLLLTSDVTKQKLAELALRASERRVQTILESLPDYVIELDAERRIRYVNRTRADVTEAAVLGQRLDDLTVPAQRDEVVRKLEHLFATGEDVRWSSSSAIDGGSYLMHAVPSAGSEPGALVIAKDITREKDAIVRLHASEERLDRAVRAGNIGLWELDLATMAVSGRGWFVRSLLEGPTLSLEGWRAAMHPDDRARAAHAMDEHLAGRSESYECEYRIRSGVGGGWTHVLDRGRAVERPRGAQVLAGTSIDVTAIRVAEAEHRALERQLEHVQRLESIGLLAGGIAHDFNNLLTVIVAGAECAKLRLAKGEPASAELTEVTEAAMRAAALTQQLLAFGRRSSLEIEDVDLFGLVRGVASMASRIFPKTIEIVLEPPEGGEAIVAADRQRLEQVFLNLCVNSRDAMPSGGRLTISLSADDTAVVVSVADTGVGIAESDRSRIFDPFFTTKPIGAGSGLGLAVAHGIVQQHGGSILVDSTPGHGTAICVRLPRHHGTVRADRAPRAAPRGGRETILVADDEPMVLRTVVRVLERAGYRVLEATDGLEAIELVRARVDEIDLVLLDVLMPRLDGWKARAQIRAIAPGMRVLLTSGYAAPAMPEGGAEQESLLAKPYLPDALLRAVRAELDRPLADSSERA